MTITAHAVITAHLADGNPELIELYNRCQFTVDDTAFTVTCKKKDWVEVGKQLEALTMFAKGVDAYWVIIRTKKRIINRMEVHLLLKFHKHYLKC